MSLFGSLNAAVSGLNAQSAALSNISDNIANSQTVGFKETDTNFTDYLTDSNSTVHSTGAVVARPNYTNNVQGAVTQVSNPTSLAISGQGFFAVQQPTGATTFSNQQFFTRTGDFQTNSSGNLINSTGYALDGWPASDASGTTFNTNQLSPITISKAPSAPVPTTDLGISANLPATPAVGSTPFNTTVQVFDAGGSAHDLNLSWAPSAAPATNSWDLTASSNGVTVGSATVQFGTGPAASGGNGGTPGTITSVSPLGGAAAAGTPGTAADVGLTLNFGLGPQQATLNLGSFGQANGLTQFSGTAYDVTGQTQNGSAQGNFTGVSIQATGEVVISYDNGTTATIAKVPLVNFNNPDALQQQDGEAYSATIDSGSPNTVASGEAGTGKLIVGAEEASNVDIATQFTQMIVAQRAYTANTKVVTTADDMMQDTLNMVQG